MLARLVVVTYLILFGFALLLEHPQELGLAISP